MNTELNAITFVSCYDILIFKVRLKVIFQCNQTKSLELIDLKKVLGRVDQSGYYFKFHCNQIGLRSGCILNYTQVAINFYNAFAKMHQSTACNCLGR